MKLVCFTNQCELELLKFNCEKYSGGTLSKDKMTVMAATNLREEKQIGCYSKSKKPLHIRNIKQLPVGFANNRKARMTSELFKNGFEIQVLIRRKRRKIIYYRFKIYNSCFYFTECNITRTVNEYR